jgi:hypothetical protein
MVRFRVERCARSYQAQHNAFIKLGFATFWICKRPNPSRLCRGRPQGAGQEKEGVETMHRQSLISCALGLAALFAPGSLTAASADVVGLYNFNVTQTLNGNTVPVFTDTFSANQVLSGGTGTVLPAGPLYSDITAALYQVIGTVTETGAPPTVLDTTQGAHLTQSPPFLPSVNANIVTLLTGPPGSPPPLSNFPLTQTSAFTTSALFSVTPPATPGGFYQVNLSDRGPSNMFLGDVISMAVVNCSPAAPTDAQCGSLAPGPYIQLVDANAFAGNIPQAIASVPLDTSNQQIMLELTKPDPLSDTVDGFYEYFNGGLGSGLIQLGSYSGLFTGQGTTPYTQAGFVQLAPVPEPSSFVLLASSALGVLGLIRLKLRDGGRFSERRTTGNGRS